MLEISMSHLRKDNCTGRLTLVKKNHRVDYIIMYGLPGADPEGVV